MEFTSLGLTEHNGRRFHQHFKRHVIVTSVTKLSRVFT